MLSGPYSAMELKDIQEWQIKRQLRTVPGVSEINNWGGEVKQYQIIVDPAVLNQYGLTLRDVSKRVSDNNENFGGGFIEHSQEQYTLRGEGRAQSIDDLKNIVMLSSKGTPVTLGQVAQVHKSEKTGIWAVHSKAEKFGGAGGHRNWRIDCSCTVAHAANPGRYVE